MAPMLNPPRLVAVDTNVALDFAKGIDDVCDAIATMQSRIGGVELWLPPTVCKEIFPLMLAWTIYISFIGVVLLMLLPRSNAQGARVIALVTAIVGLVLGLGATWEYKIGSGIVTVTKVPWIPSLGINYHLAAD